MLTNLLWFSTGLLVSGWWFRHPKDYYVVETVCIMEGTGGKQTDIELISGNHIWPSMFSVTPDGGGYVVRRKGQRQAFAQKGFVIFDDYAAARENFNRANLNGPAQGWVAHRIFLWAVYASHRGAVSRRLVKSRGNPRQLAETDYAAVLAMYRKSLTKIVADE